MKKRIFRIISVGIISIILYYFVIWNTELYYILEDTFHSETYGTWIGMIGIVFFIKLILKIIFRISNELKDFLSNFCFPACFQLLDLIFF